MRTGHVSGSGRWAHDLRSADVIGLTRDPSTFLADRLRRATDDALTYAEVGLTRTANLPPGYHHDRRSVHVGEDERAWDRARDAIRRWRAHAHAGITITPADAAVTEGTTVIASRVFGPLIVVAPCRIVYVTEEPARFGFAYGTLPGHPEKGEEAFHVLRHEDGSVTAEIVVFSGYADLTTKVASPVARQIQKAATRRYLDGIRNYVAEGTKG